MTNKSASLWTRPCTVFMASDPKLPLDAFIDVITQDVLVDPVVAADGYSYSRSAIEYWLREHDTSPMTNLRLANRRLVPNIHMRWVLEEWRERQPLAFDASRLTLTDKLLGEGSYGVVYAGLLDAGNGARRALRVAVKVLPSLTQEQERESIERELKVYMHAARQCDGVCILHGTCKKGLPGAPGTQRLCIVMCVMDDRRIRSSENCARAAYRTATFPRGRSSSEQEAVRAVAAAGGRCCGGRPLHAGQGAQDGRKPLPNVAPAARGWGSRAGYQARKHPPRHVRRPGDCRLWCE